MPIVLGVKSGSIIGSSLSSGRSYSLHRASPVEVPAVIYPAWTIEKTGGVDGTWDAGAVSQSFSGDAYVQATAEIGVNQFIGFSVADTDQSYTTIDYAAYISSGLEVYELGNLRFSSVPFTPGDVIKVNRTGTTVTYLKNGVVFHTSAVASSGALRVDTSIRSTGPTYGWKNIRLYLNGVSAAMVWSNAVNATVTQES